ncbi:MAG: transposase [Flavobacteriales bacterium]
MSEIRKANLEGAAYFVTLTVEGWVDVFTRKALVDELVTNLRYCQEHKGLEIFAYVIMPSHLHLIARREGGLLSDLLRDFKAFTAKQLLALIDSHPGESRREWMLPFFGQQAVGKAQNKHFAFWQKDSHPIELWSGKVVEQKIKYIHDNPVEAGIVTEAHHYLLSSAHLDGPLVLNGYLEREEGKGLF